MGDTRKYARTVDCGGPLRLEINGTKVSSSAVSHEAARRPGRSVLVAPQEARRRALCLLGARLGNSWSSRRLPGKRTVMGQES